jgi:RND superfamily putative drug exporter
VPVLGRNLGRADAVEGHFWRRIVDGVLRRPVLWLTVAVVGLLAAASPIFGLHIGANGVSTLPDNVPSKQGYVLLQRSFPVQSPEPVNVVAVGGDPTTRADLDELSDRLKNDPRFGVVRTSSRKHVYLLTVPLRGDPAGTAAVAAVRELRGRLVPSVFADSAARVYVGGQTAEDVDYFDAVTNPTPYVLLFVLGLSFILLTIAFRSIVIAVVSVLLNMLSVPAAYGFLLQASSASTPSTAVSASTPSSSSWRTSTS